MSKLVNILILLPIGVVLVLLSVANRQSVTMALNPFNAGDKVLSVSAPSLFTSSLPSFSVYWLARCLPGSRNASTEKQQNTASARQRSGARRPTSRKPSPPNFPPATLSISYPLPEKTCHFPDRADKPQLSITPE
nr:hypothetical protein [Marinicella sp. W31]MDC2876423.1 hypothetical protein [Marinicella sp. W31]